MRFLCTILFALPTVLFAATPPEYKPTEENLLACDIDLGPDITVCNNARFTLNPKPVPNGTYTWTGSNGLSCYDCPSPEVSGLSTGIYIYIATVTTPDCSESDTIRITVINGQAPQYEIAESQHICAGDSIQLGGPAVAGTFYNWNSIPIGFASTLANPKVKPLNPITYYLSATTNSCPLVSIDSVTITPVSLSLQLDVQDTFRLCRGSSRTIQAIVNPSGPVVSWAPASGLQVGTGGATVVATPIESTLYTATVSLSGCTRTKKVYAAVDSLPANLSIKPADTTICQGSQVILVSPVFEPVDFPNITFQWTPPAGMLTPDSLYNLVVQPTQTTIYRRITRNGLCVDTALATVKVIPPAQITVIPSDTTVCPGSTVQYQLTYTNGVTDIKWEPPTGLSCTTCDNPLATASLGQTYQISGEFQGCKVNATARINTYPLAPIKFPSDLKLCAGESITLNELADLSVTYTWTSTHPGFGTKVTPAPIFTPSQTATYFVTADNGCIRKDSVTVTVLSATLTATGDTTICKNNMASLKATASLPGVYRWVNNQTGQVVGNQPAITVKPDQTTVYTLTFTFGDNCVLTDEVTVTVSGEAPTIAFPTELQTCPGDTVLLNTAPVIPGAVYNWTANPPDPGLKPTSPAPLVSPLVNTTYSVVATLGNCSVSQQVSIVANRATLQVTPDTTVCDGTLTTLTASGSAANGSYSWSTGSLSPSISVMPSGNSTYTVTYTFGSNCVLQDSVQVSVVPNFSVTINSFPIKDTVNVGDMLTLTAIVDPPQNLKNFKFLWQEITNDTKDLPSMTESIDVVPSSNDTATGEIRYRLIVTSPNGCVQIVEKRFYLIFPIVRFPNAFTPNNDGDNDVFKMAVPQGLAYIAQMQIFNRWGQKVFESFEPDATWDGMVSGKEAPIDIYVYYVWWRRGDNALQVQATGELSLLR